jgi:hypothetical protein
LYTDNDSEEELEDTTIQDPSSAEENDEDLEWHHQLPSDKADVHQFFGKTQWAEQNHYSQYC